MPDNFESHNFLKLSFTNIEDLPSNVVESESYLASNSPDIFALREKNLYDSIDCGNFFGRGYLPLIQKDAIGHMYGLHRRTSFWMGLMPRKFCGFLLTSSTGFTSLSVLLIFPLLIIFILYHLYAWFLILFHIT